MSEENYRVFDDQGLFLPHVMAVLRMNIIASWPDANSLPTDAQIALIAEKVRMALIEGNLAMMAVLGTAAVRLEGKRLLYNHRPADQTAALRAAAGVESLKR